MKTILLLIGILLVVASAIAGLYVGIVWCIIGGAIQFIEACKHDFDVTNMVIGFVRFWFAGAIGWITFFIGTLTSAFFIGSAYK